MTTDGTRETIEAEIAEAQAELDHFDASDHASHSDYDDWLDEVCDEVCIGSLTYSPSRVLKDVDPIAYRCGFSDYCDGLDPSDFEEYREIEERIEDLQDELDGLMDEDDD